MHRAIDPQAGDVLHVSGTMGMHVWYDLALGDDATFDDAITKIRDLHRYARTVGFLGAHEISAVGEVGIGDGTEPWPPTYTIEIPLGDHRAQHIHVPASEWVGFSAMPGLGTESATFGLARYPESFRPTGKQSQIVTSTRHLGDGTIEADPSPIVEPVAETTVDARGWSSWHGWCKTKYAHRYGLDHFLHCHLALVKLLDHANDIGILERVADEGGYWESRSVDVLVANLRENDRIVAAIVGSLNDRMRTEFDQTDYVSIAPILGAPDFEYLEAEGRALRGYTGD